MFQKINTFYYNYKNLTGSFFLLGFYFFCLNPILGQGKQVDIINSDVLENVTIKGNTVKKLRGNVVMRQDNTNFTCDSAFIYSTSNIVKSYGRITVLQNDVRIAGDDGTYNGNTHAVDLGGKVVTLADSKSKITTTKMNYNMNSKVAFYTNNATVETETSKLTSRRGYYDTKTKESYFKGNVHVVDPKFVLDADTLRMNAETKLVTLVAPTTVVAEGGKSKIYAERGFYDNGKGFGKFWRNAYLEQGVKKGRGDTIRYDGNTKLLYLIGNAHFTDGDQSVDSDKIIYDEATGSATTDGRANIKNGTQTVVANKTRYDKATDMTVLQGDVIITDIVKQQILSGDSVAYSKKSRIGFAKGNVQFVDDKQGTIVKANRIKYNDSTGYILATEHPVLITKMEKDSLFLAADTLKSIRTIGNIATTTVSKGISEKTKLDTKNKSTTDKITTIVTKNTATNTTDTTRTVYAYHRVRIYKRDLQAVADSLTYASTDSTFKFYGKPILWSDTTQFAADTIHLRMRNKKIDAVDLYQNSFIINSPDLIFYNQIKGRQIFAKFKQNKLDNMNVQGNAESVYYAIDNKKAYVGVNKTAASSMLITVDENKVQQIHFYTQPQATFTPMKQADHNKIRIEGWKWQFDIRPKGKWDLFR